MMATKRKKKNKQSNKQINRRTSKKKQTAATEADYVTSKRVYV